MGDLSQKFLKKVRAFGQKRISNGTTLADSKLVLLQDISQDGKQSSRSSNEEEGTERNLRPVIPVVPAKGKQRQGSTIVPGFSTTVNL